MASWALGHPTVQECFDAFNIFVNSCQVNVTVFFILWFFNTF